jgi:hypothetical protein
MSPHACQSPHRVGSGIAQTATDMVHTKPNGTNNLVKANNPFFNIDQLSSFLIPILANMGFVLTTYLPLKRISA